MLHFNKLEPGKLYRTKNRITLPKNKMNNGRDNLVTFFVDDSKTMMNLLENPYWDSAISKYYRYYIPKRMSHRVTTKLKRVLLDRQEYYAENIIPNIPEKLKIRLALLPSTVKNYNTYYDISQYMKWINTDVMLESKPINDRALIKAENVLSVLSKISSEMTLHQNKYLYIPIDLYIENIRNKSIFSAYKMKDNPVIYLLNYIQEFHSELAIMTDWTLVFTNVNELFYIPMSSINAMTYTEILNIFKKCRSMRGFAYVDESDDDNIELISDDSSDTATVIDNIEDKVIKKVKHSIAQKNIQPEKIEEPKPEIVPSITNKRIFTKKEEPKPVNKPAPKIVEKEKVEPKIPDEEIKKLEIAKKELMKELDKQELNVSHSRLARLKSVQDNIKNLKIEEKTFEQLAVEASNRQIDPIKIEDIDDIDNEDMKEIKFAGFERGYNEKLKKYHITAMLESFAYKDKPLYLISLDVEDISDNIDKIERYHCVFEDEKGKRHSFSFDLPKMIDDRFLHLSGSRKLMVTQQAPLPLIKTGPDTVQVATNDNKIFIYRFGQNLSPKINKFNKSMDSISRNTLTYKRGNNLADNSTFMTSLEYDEMSSKFSSITIVPDKLEIHFNQKVIRELCKQYNLSFNEFTEIPFAIDLSNIKTPKLITLDVTNDTVNIGNRDMSPVDFIIEAVNKYESGFKKEFLGTNVGKRYVYTRAKIMHKYIPLILLTSAIKGLTTILRLAKINYSFHESRPSITGNDKVDKGIVEFKDGYLVYDQYPFSNSLLMNGLFTLPTKEYSFYDFDIHTTYYDILQKMYGRKNLLDAFDNYNQVFIDVPITRDVLLDHNLPTDFCELLLVANNMLENNAFITESNIANFRYRNNELVNVFLYKALSQAYISYRSTADNRNPVKFSIKQNQVITSILESHVTEEYSKLSPIFEIERLRSTTVKGPGGCNMDRAMSISKRSYDPSMLGVMAQSSPISANIGVSRVMSIDPNITSLMGYVKSGSIETAENLKSTQLLSGAELLVPFSATHDDPQRVSMMSVQSRHTMPVVGSGTAIFGTGFDRTIAHLISNDYAYKAKLSGKVISIDKKLGIMIIEYSDGSKTSIDISDKQAKNASGGFYVTNKLTPVFDVGDAFKKGQIIAIDDAYFVKINKEVILKTGVWANVAVIHSSGTFEDSTKVTEALALKMSSFVTHEKSVSIGKNSNIYNMVKVGDMVKANDPLLVFDESYEDDYLNKILAKISENDIENLVANTQTPVKSKRSGEVVDIKIYYTVPKEEMSQSLQDIITEYENKIISRNKVYNKHSIDTKDLTSQIETIGMSVIKNGKLKGQSMGDNHILIEFYVREYDKFGVGDKLTFDTALKGINQTLIPLGKEPVTFSDPNKTVDAFVGVSGVYARMTNSFNMSMALNATLFGMEENIKAIYEKHFKK